ncbi:MAG: FRG domain-containing protein [Cardiobacteriaceae bacterium]|nr:FRG domain-containing protein [Cardiobacteriaceae bacterium]
MEITSVAELAEALIKLKSPREGCSRFFRGHSDCSYLLEPSIYRRDEKNSSNDPTYLIKNEDKIIRDVLINCSDSFNPSDTLFEKLAKMQHYGYATRLLDLTTNALVALYFSVQENNDKDGELLVLDIPNEEIKYDDSDLVSVLSAVSLRDDSFSLKDIIESSKVFSAIEAIKFCLKNRKIIKVNEDIILKIKVSLNNNPSQINIKNIFDIYMDLVMLQEDELVKKSIDGEYNDSFIKTFNRQDKIKKLIRDIRNEKPYFSPDINPDDFRRVVCVQAKKSNPRIAKQQGCFLLFGFDGEKKTKAEVENSWRRTIVDSDRLIIKRGEAKDNILKELKSFGISHQNLFPELDTQARDILSKYRKN